MTAYQSGGRRDRQQRVAQISQDIGQLDGILPLLLGGGSSSVVGATHLAMPPAYLGNAERTRRFVAVRSNTPGEFNGVLPQLLGQDKLPPGQTTYDTRRPFFFLRRPSQHGLFDVGNNGIVPEKVIVSASVPIGQSTLDSRLPPAPRLSAAALRDHIDPSELWLFGTDAMLVGDQLSGNPPPGARRANPQLDQPNILLALLTVFVPPIPQGEQLTDSLNPRTAARARDYTFTAPTPLNLIGQDRVYGAPGEAPAYDWSYQRPKPRYLQGTGEPVQDLLSTLLGAVPMPPGEQTYDSPTPGPRRARDYTWLQTLPQHIYQAPPPGDTTASSELAPRAWRRMDLTWVRATGPGLLALVPPPGATVVPRCPVTVGARSFITRAGVRPFVSIVPMRSMVSTVSVRPFASAVPRRGLVLTVREC